MRTQGIVCSILLGLMVFVGGCSSGKKVTVHFRNTAPRPFDLYVTVPSQETHDLGRIAPEGGEKAITLSVDKENLPTRVTWEASNRRGKHKDRFRIHEDTSRDLLVIIPEGRVIPYDEHKARRKRKGEDDD